MNGFKIFNDKDFEVFACIYFKLVHVSKEN
jgi:hypothetical protein